MNLFRTKPVAAVVEAEGGEHTLKRVLTAHHLVHAWNRRGHRRRHLRDDRQCSRKLCRPGDHPQFRDGRHCLRLRGSLLRGIRGHAASLGQRLFLFLCDPRRSGRMVHRLDADTRIHVRGSDRRGRLVRLFRRSARIDRQCVRNHACPAGSADQCAAQRRPGPARADRRADQPAGGRDRHRRGRALLPRHHAIRDGQRGHRAGQGRRHPALHGGDHCST